MTSYYTSGIIQKPSQKRHGSTLKSKQWEMRKTKRTFINKRWKSTNKKYKTITWKFERILNDFQKEITKQDHEVERPRE